MAPGRFGPLGSFRQNKAGNGASTRGKSVDFVPHLFSRKKSTKNPRQVVPKITAVSISMATKKCPYGQKSKR
jgi:hypothetical protein